MTSEYKWTRHYKYLTGKSSNQFFNGASYRITKWYYKPIQSIGSRAQKLLILLGCSASHRYYWWIRKNITHD